IAPPLNIRGQVTWSPWTFFMIIRIFVPSYLLLASWSVVQPLQISPRKCDDIIVLCTDYSIVRWRIPFLPYDLRSKFIFPKNLATELQKVCQLGVIYAYKYNPVIAQ